MRDPLSGHVLAFAEDDLAAAVAQLLANGGFVATRLAPVPDGTRVQLVGSEEETLTVVRLLLAELGHFPTGREQISRQQLGWGPNLTPLGYQMVTFPRAFLF